MVDEWPCLIFNFAILSLLLLGATLLRSRLKVLQKLLIPNSITAGFIGLILGSQVLGLFDIPLEMLKEYSHHLLAITFIAISLKGGEAVKGKDSLRTAFCYTLGYGLQVIVGMGLALLILSHLFPGFGATNGLLVIYMAALLLIKGGNMVVGLLPGLLGFFVEALLKYHFIIAALLAMLCKRIIILFKGGYLLDKGLCERAAGISVDYMVTASISAISLVVVGRFIVPILIVALTAGGVTLLYCLYLGSRTFDSYRFERIVAIFGVTTGTMATGLALLRVLDPGYKSPVAAEMMYGAGLAFFIALPIMIVTNLPLRAIMTGQGYLSWLGLLIVVIYVTLLLIVWRVSGLIGFGGGRGRLYRR